MDRRRAIKGVLCSGAAIIAPNGFAASHATPIIDSHIHLFDPSRPEGVSWPEKSDAILYRPALPARYIAVAAGTSIVGAIAIEASPSKADNDWLLKTAQENNLIVGIVGNLIPDAPDFGKDLERLHRNPLYLGVRYGNLWQRNLALDLDRPGFLDGLRLLAECGLVLESANPDPPLLDALARISERLPNLTVVVDHLPHAVVPTSLAERKRYQDTLRILSASPRVFVKLSEIPAERNGTVPAEIGAYRDHLDRIWDQFGEGRLIYGSDWPNSDHLLSFRATFNLIEAYLHEKSAFTRELVYWRNSARAYRWRPKTAAQPHLLP